MNHTEKLAPIAAAVTALTTMACCLPLGIAAAAATAGVSAFAAEYQPWLLGASGLMLAAGLVQLRSARRSCARRSYSSVMVFVISMLIVLTVTFFPQLVAGASGWLR